MKTLLLCLLAFLSIQSMAQTPVKVAVAGLSHGHVGWIFNRSDKKDIELVGIYETNPDLVNLFMTKYKLDKKLFFTDLNKMLDEAKPEAVSAFGAINEHIAIVRACAPRKIHVMVEKPLATTFADAKEIQKLADQNGIQVLTNYETSWYASNQHVRDLVEQGKLGEIRKVMVNDGHQGPKEIGVSKEFLAILTDPVKNGAGALIDFGCYGANLMTWLLKGERPLSVTAVTHQNKPEIYKEVDDEASIILQYPKAQCIIQGSWNWSFARKDMEVFGNKGYAVAVNATTVRQRLAEKTPEETIKLDPRPAPFTDPFSVLADVIQGRLKLEKNDLYGLPVNVTVVEILETAKESAKSGKTIYLKK
ncbi:Gfo/Idh/MocA family protein [Dyadobacter fanqingshengii]|uniref:Gfo/Idh/MocA family oxidoreductase n=1 Tax=Dyadobacter fanqingshengii TaxID=2906443 RepID=A0A9X1P846_9BACT|nr:Gfo/Idh/MocA family oxidoreductase [Dyadobacter fanqingshengii]MCF0038918.1 Gfo/Idh/MocA family oxidoreductase [Dyadobacter fanqingshengii]MCF2503539.1 Gfo/Idh/MocA family oxidoreductase [Dyadobacter fanqingshengii]USJ34258.1 Gfo/Idh/MocA family oxidoreductase [Dyadobacter fanqingshengii]